MANNIALGNGGTFTWADTIAKNTMTTVTCSYCFAAMNVYYNYKENKMCMNCYYTAIESSLLQHVALQTVAKVCDECKFEPSYVLCVEKKYCKTCFLKLFGNTCRKCNQLHYHGHKDAPRLIHEEQKVRDLFLDCNDCMLNKT